MKHTYGYDIASSSGLIGMEMQGVLAIFSVNIKANGVEILISLINS